MFDAPVKILQGYPLDKSNITSALSFVFLS